jgi:opacity protein-like surface antigen
MKNIFAALFCFLLCATPASAQSPVTVASSDAPVTEVRGETRLSEGSGKTPIALASGKPLILPIRPIRARPPLVAGRGKMLDVSLGYAYVSSGQSLAPRLGLRGADASATMGFYRLGLKVDLGYARAANVLGTGHRSDVFTYMAGPVFYPTRHRNFNTYVHVLVGGSKVSGPVRVADGRILLGGWMIGYAWAGGGGVEYWLSDSLAIRTGADFMRTAYFDATLAVRSQYSIRTTATAVYFFGRRSRTPR